MRGHVRPHGSGAVLIVDSSIPGWLHVGIVDTGILATNIETGWHDYGASCDESPAAVELSTASDTAIVDDVGKSASKLS